MNAEERAREAARQYIGPRMDDLAPGDVKAGLCDEMALLTRIVAYQIRAAEAEAYEASAKAVRSPCRCGQCETCAWHTDLSKKICALAKEAK